MYSREAVVVIQNPESVCDQILDKLFSLSTMPNSHFTEVFALAEEDVRITVDEDDDSESWVIADTFVHHDSVDIEWECLLYRPLGPQKQFIKVVCIDGEISVIQAVVITYPGEHSFKTPNLQVLNLLAR
jgi:hypothetical protein